MPRTAKTEIMRVATNDSKTSILVPEKGLLFIVHSKTDIDMAGHLVPSQSLIVTYTSKPGSLTGVRV